MPASRSDRGRRAARLLFAGLVAIAVGYPGASRGQQIGPPIQLLPPTPDGSAGRRPLPIDPIVPPPPPVTAEPLSPPSPGWAGDTTPPGPALPRDLWRGTPRALAETLLGQLPETTSPALQQLERRLLLSPGVAPAGAAPATPEQGLPALRVAALLRLGEADAARKVIAAMPQPDRGAVMRLSVEADILTGGLDKACDEVADVIRRDQGAYWQRSLIACQTVRGDSEKASLGLQLLAEEKTASDDALAAAVDALAGRPAPAVIDHLDRPDPLLLRALDAAHRRLAPGVLARLRPDLALVLAQDDKAAPETRLEAAERAALYGALGADKLAALYMNYAGEPTGKGGGSPSLDRARRFAALAAASGPGERLAGIVAFVDTFPDRDAGGLLLAAHLVAAPLKTVAADADLAVSAPLAARLSVAVGDFDGARRWAAFAPPTESPILRLIIALAEGKMPADADPAAGEGDKAASRGLALALRTGLAEPPTGAAFVRLPASAWTQTGGPSPPVAAWLDLTDAARAKRVGETALAAALVAAPHGDLVKDGIALYGALTGLQRIGLDADARRLAAEAALAL